MKQFILKAGIIAMIAASLAFQPGRDVANKIVLVSAIDADGTTDTITLSQESMDCVFVNRDTTATNTTDLTLNGDADKIRLYGGDVISVNSDIPFSVASFKFDAVVGTPDVQYYCTGR